MSDAQKILVVEDNDFVRMQMVKFLQDAGYVLVEASDGNEAVSIATSQKDLKLALVDVRMEPVDGFDFIRTIHGRDIKIPVILVTGDDNPDLLDTANKLGVGAVLMKPVQKDRLIKTVERTILIAQRRATE